MSDDNKVHAACIPVSFVFGLLLGAIAGCTAGVDARDKFVRNEAVKAGAAEWVAGEDGEAEFRWRTE